MIKLANTLLELILRNYCLRSVKCRGCKFQHENTGRSSSVNVCLVSKNCVMDVIGRDYVICEECIFERSDAICLALDTYNIHPLKCGYWSVKA